LKILYLSKAIFPSEISHSLSIMRVCQALYDMGNEVILTGIKSNKIDDDPIKYYGVNGGFNINLVKSTGFLNNQLLRLTNIIISIKNWFIIKKEKPDIIYSRLTLVELLFVPKKIPIIYEMHSLSYIGKKWHKKLIFLLILKRKNLDRIIVTTHSLAKMLQNYFPKIKIIVAQLSAELPITISEKQKNTFLNNNLLNNKFNKHIGYTGYLDNYGLRGTDIICRIASIMPEYAFHVVGGEEEIVAYWIKYGKTINNNNNLFFYGYRNSNQIPYFLKIFDVVLAPLQYRPTKRAPLGMNASPLKLSQYMAYGKPIIASDIYSHKELLVDGENALLVEPNDINEWAKAIERVINDDSLSKRLSINSKNYYYSKLTPQKRIEVILDGFVLNNDKVKK